MTKSEVETEAERLLAGLVLKWRANADMLGEGYKGEGFDEGAGMQRACADELDAAITRLRAQSPWQPRAELAEAFLEREGYQRCDIAACNCGSWHQTRHRPGWTEAKVQRVGQAAFALSNWFTARGEKPDEWMALFSEIIIADDQTLTVAEIRHAHELIADGKLPQPLPPVPEQPT